MKTDKVLIEVLNNHFAGIADEMAYTIHRAGYTIFIKETWDFCAGLVTKGGEVFGYPANIAATNLLGIDLSTAIARSGTLEPGDVIICNDPHSTQGMCTHLPDYHMFKPIFFDGELLCYVWCFIHSSDVGGLVPGSIAPSAYDRLQEGFVLPPTKLVKAGELDNAIADIIRANSRIPDLNWGDIRAMLSAMAVGERRIEKLVERYGARELGQAIDDILAYGEERARQIFSEIPDGEYEFTDYLEADFVTPYFIRLKVKVVVSGGSIHLDFTGSDAQVRAALNLPSYGKANQWLLNGVYRYLRTTDGKLALNRGILRPVSVNVPAGSILNASPMAATGVRHAAAYRVSDAILGALSIPKGEQIPAANAGHLAIVMHSHLDTARGDYRVGVLQPLQGGSGGRPTKDGIDGVNFSNSLRNIPTESIEVESPVLVHRYMLAEDCAPGEYRGGAGVVFEFQSFAPNSIVTARGMDRYCLRPYGREGGSPGSVGSTVLNPGDSDERNVGKIDILKLEPGDIVRIIAPGGGGFGSPLKRKLADIKRDLDDGLLTKAQAEAHYGVVFKGDDIDEAASGKRREELRAQENVTPFSFGPERTAYEERFPASVQDLISEVIGRYPATSRAYLREKLFGFVNEAKGKQITVNDLEAFLEELRQNSSVRRAKSA